MSWSSLWYCQGRNKETHPENLHRNPTLHLRRQSVRHHPIQIIILVTRRLKQHEDIRCVALLPDQDVALVCRLEQVHHVRVEVTLRVGQAEVDAADNGAWNIPSRLVILLIPFVCELPG